MATSAELVSPAKIFARSTGGATWLGRKQRDALDHLLSRVNVRILLGPPSSGKSSILRLLEQQASEEGLVLLRVFGPQTSPLGVLSTLLAAAEFSLWTLSEIEQRNLLTVFIEQRRLQGARVAICIENISKFSSDAWEEIERLTELRQDGQPAVELIIIATERDASRAPLDEFIQNGRMRPIDSIHFLSAPDGQDLESYISWRLARFGIHGTFTAGACAAIAQKARGRFNSINLLCQCLFLDRQIDRPVVIDEEAVTKAVAKLGSLKDSDPHSSTQKLPCLPSAEASGPAPVPGRLAVTINGKDDCVIPLTGPVVIGRGSDADLKLNSRFISRRHAVVVPQTDGRFSISDLESRNGVLVNGQFVKRAVLNDGDVIDLGEICIRVELEGPAAAGYRADTLPYVGAGDTDIMPAPDLQFANVQGVQGR